MHKNNIYLRERHLATWPSFRIATVEIPLRNDAVRTRKFTIIIAGNTGKYRNRVVSGRLVGNYPLSLDERIAEARKKLEKMSIAEKWELVEKGFGMWKDYSEDWLKELRAGNFSHDDYIKDGAYTDYVLLG
jgi:hypothetical protein